MPVSSTCLYRQGQSHFRHTNLSLRQSSNTINLNQAISTHVLIVGSSIVENDRPIKLMHDITLINVYSFVRIESERKTYHLQANVVVLAVILLVMQLLLLLLIILTSKVLIKKHKRTSTHSSTAISAPKVFSKKHKNITTSGKKLGQWDVQEKS